MYAKVKLHPVELKNIKDGDIVESVLIEIKGRVERKLVIGGIHRPLEGCTVGRFPKTRKEILFVEQK